MQNKSKQEMDRVIREMFSGKKEESGLTSKEQIDQVIREMYYGKKEEKKKED